MSKDIGRLPSEAGEAEPLPLHAAVGPAKGVLDAFFLTPVQERILFIICQRRSSRNTLSRLAGLSQIWTMFGGKELGTT